MPEILELFAGGGIATAGALAAGYTPVGAIEFAEEIAEVYRDNYGDHVRVARVEEVDYREWAGVDAMWASPVCTRASVANPDAKESPEDIATAEAVVWALREARPRVFVLENVQGYAKFESFQVILRGLRELGYQARWSVVNAADMGVPQTRRRLILRAVWNGRVPDLAATHCEGGAPDGQGSLFEEHSLLPWVGWYAAVEDLLPTCPESKLAEWQLKRLPDRLETLLVTNQGSQPSGTPGRAAKTFGINEPSGPIIAESATRTRALLVDAQQTAITENGRRTRRFGSGEPAFCVTSTTYKGMPQAVLVHGTSDMGVRDGRSPAATVEATVIAKASAPKAILVDGYGNCSREPTILPADEPAMTMQAWHGRRPSGAPRDVLISNSKTAWSDGTRGDEEPALSVTGQHAGRLRALLENARVVSMTPRCLARFQSLPDWYKVPLSRSLAARVIGNGVPSLLAQRILESLL